MTILPPIVDSTLEQKLLQAIKLYNFYFTDSHIKDDADKYAGQTIKTLIAEAKALITGYNKKNLPPEARYNVPMSLLLLSMGYSLVGNQMDMEQLVSKELERVEKLFDKVLMNDCNVLEEQIIANLDAQKAALVTSEQWIEFLKQNEQAIVKLDGVTLLWAKDLPELIASSGMLTLTEAVHDFIVQQLELLSSKIELKSTTKPKLQSLAEELTQLERLVNWIVQFDMDILDVDISAVRKLLKQRHPKIVFQVAEPIFKEELMEELDSFCALTIESVLADLVKYQKKYPKGLFYDQMQYLILDAKYHKEFDLFMSLFDYEVFEEYMMLNPNGLFYDSAKALADMYPKLKNYKELS